MAKKRTSPIGGVLDITNPEFLKQYAGQKILSKEQGKVYEVGAGGVSESAFDPQIANQHFAALFGAKTGLQPTSAPGGGYATSEAFKYFLPQAQETARIATGDFGAAAGGDPIPSAVIGRTGGTVQAAGETGIVQNPNAPIGWGNDPVTGKMVKITPTTEGTGWYDEVTGKDTPVGVGTPRPTATPIADQTLGLQAALDRNDPNNPTDVANIAYAKSKGLLATLTSPTGEKVQVAVGSQRANDLLSQNYTLGDKIGGDILTSETIAQESEIDTTSFQDNSTSSQSPADTTKAAEVTQKTIEDYIKLIEGKETETSQAVDTLQGDVLKLIGEQAGQTELLEDELKKAGADQFKENLKNINNEIGIKTAALNSRLAEIEATPMTLARMGGEEAKARRIAQSDIMFLQAQAQSAMNNLSFAQETAQAAVDAKYNPIIEELNIKLQQLKIIEGRENKEEATYAQALSLLLQEQKDAQVEAKNNEAGVNSIIMEIIANNPNISKDRIIDQIKNASSPIEAMQIAGGLATGTGYQYVATPAERDNYIAQGYELIQSGGRTYAKLGGGGSSQEVNAYVQQIQAGKLKLTNVPAELRGEVAVALGGATPGPSPSKPLKPEEEMNAELSKVVGSDGFISPDDYLKARNAWIAQELSPTVFDTKFRGFRDPNNPYYITKKQSVDSSGRSLD